MDHTIQTARNVLTEAWASLSATFTSGEVGQSVLPCIVRTPLSREVDFEFASSSEAETSGGGSLRLPEPRTILDDGKVSIVSTPEADNAEKKIRILSSEDLKKMPLDDKISLLENLRSGIWMSEKQRAAQRKIYNSMNLDSSFVKWDDKKRKELIKLLKEDETITNARKKWPTMTNDERAAILNKVMVDQAYIYGFPVVPINLKRLEPTKDTDGKSLITSGFFHLDDDPKKNSITINTHPDSDFHSFAAAINTITHENAHNFQSHLAEKYRNKTLQKTDERYTQAKIFYYNSNDEEAYVSGSENYDDYLKQPIEEHAFKTGNSVGQALSR